jgi:hypothetical protein
VCGSVAAFPAVGQLTTARFLSGRVDADRHRERRAPFKCGGRSVSVTVTLRDRLGNNLFQYAIARIIAEHHGFSLACTRCHDRQSKWADT